ncbi:replication initiation protein [Pleurocapsales cyanobacterium LEGE 10410]|nr:replication initiation protein [Pleurocapsales cyanobacterium LEGE 10410]
MNLQPHGSIEGKNATYPLPQQMAYTRIKRIHSLDQAKIRNSTMKAIDYKMLATLLFLSYRDLTELSGKGLWHEIEGQKLLSIFSEHSGTKDINLLWESFTRIASFVVDYQRSEGDRRFRGVTALIQMEEEFFKNKSIFRFRFPDQLVPILLNPKLFAVLKINLILEMRSKYSIALYQILVPYAEMKYKNSTMMTVVDFKEWLKVPYSEKKSSAWKRFGTLKQSVIDPAVDELNQLCHLTGFTVSYELYRRGRGGAVKEIRFDVEKVGTTPQQRVQEDFQRSTVDSESEHQKNQLSNLSEAVEIITYFEKVRNNTAIDPQHLTSEELSKAEAFIQGFDSLEIAKEVVSIICHFDTKPDFFGGLFKHKARAAAILNQKKEKEIIDGKHNQIKVDSQNKLKIRKEAYQNECEEYFAILPKEETEAIEESIVRNIPVIMRVYFNEKRDTIAGESIRRDALFRWWLEKEKNLDETQIQQILS